MKLSENELQELARQLRCPDGESGLKVGEMMNFTNSNIISKAIESLNLKDGDTVLEIGPGNGAHVKDIVSRANVGYFGIDISETMIAEAEKLNADLYNAAFYLTNGEHIPFSENHFDAAFTCNTIYFWKNPQEYANEIARVLQLGGIISIGFIPESTMQKIPFAKYGFTLYDIETVSKLMEDAGLSVIAANTDTEMVMSNSGEQIEREFVILTAKKQ
ncbi:MAG: class I SAM-dependent methyltransferase [Flavobacterium psychrophilum]|nr:MAG: class I SAM-dependent methyltransferase [Flavobacterium psychrophilum]